jgi:hypothetical protein
MSKTKKRPFWLDIGYKAEDCIIPLLKHNLKRLRKARYGQTKYDARSSDPNDPYWLQIKAFKNAPKKGTIMVQRASKTLEAKYSYLMINLSLKIKGMFQIPRVVLDGSYRISPIKKEGNAFRGKGNNFAQPKIEAIDNLVRYVPFDPEHAKVLNRKFEMYYGPPKGTNLIQQFNASQ